MFLEGPRRRSATLGVAGSVVAFWLMATLAQPWRLLAVGSSTSKFYDGQAHRLLTGHLSVPSSLVGSEGFTTPHGTQMYFGLTPSILRLPFAVLGHWFDGRLTVLSQLVAVAVLGWASARLFRRAEVALGAGDGAPEGRIVWPYVWMAAAPTVASPILFLASRPVVYVEAVLWGAAAGVCGLEMVLAWWHDPTRRRLALAALVSAGALGARPTSGAAPFVALVVFGLVLLARREWRRAVAALSAATAAAGTYVAINVARFHLFFGAPFDQQVFTSINAGRRAMLAANNGAYFRPLFMPTTMLRYLSPVPGMLRPTSVFPFITWGRNAPVLFGAHFDTVTQSGSFPVAAPLLVLFAIIGAVSILRRRAFRSWWAIAFGAAVGTVPTFMIGYVAHRYLSDLVPLFVVLAAPGTWVGVFWWRRRKNVVRRATWAAASAVTSLAVIGQVAITLNARMFMVGASPDDRLAFVTLQYRIDGWLHDGAPSHVTVGPTVPPINRLDEGDLAIVGRCAGLYRFDGHLWMALDRTPGAGTRVVVVPDAVIAPELGHVAVTIATGDRWAIVAQPVGDGSHVTLAFLGPPRDVYSPLPVDAQAGFDIVVDRETRELSVRQDGHTLLSSSMVVNDGLQPAQGWTSRFVSPGLCESLLARIGPRTS
jgi:hypothetical protein